VPQTIALVDDDRNILTSVSMTLEAEGFAVRTYTDGAEALRALMQSPVDLAVLDIKMPRMDGMELPKLRKSASCRSSSSPQRLRGGRIDGLRMGADDTSRRLPAPADQRIRTCCGAGQPQHHGRPARRRSARRTT
jgi:two-component system response regulator ChvI